MGIQGLGNALDGHNMHYIGSQFQAIFARRAFPCFDEPAMKASFEVTLIRPKHLVSLFNTDISYSEEWGQDLKADHYEITPSMSTYLFAVVIGNFSSIELLTNSKIKIKLWGRPSVLRDSQYTAKIAVDIFNYLEDFFNVSYPLKKLDIVALPEFQFGAMENWGLILMREEYFLYNPLIDSMKQQEDNCMVLAHEIGHQWFGNLVSPSWWDNLWLNEGFATFLQYTTCSHVEPTWHLDDLFIANIQSNVLVEDSSRYTHAIKKDISTYQDLLTMFNVISYFKGGSIILMIEDAIGRKTLQQGLSEYLKKMAYKNAQEKDLWYFLSKAMLKNNIDIDLVAVMEPWILQPGYPLVNIIRNYKDGSAKVIQEQYFENTVDNNNSIKWNLPVTLLFRDENGSQINQELWLFDKTETLELLPSSNWIIANRLRHGFYRVNYDQMNWILLIQQLKTDFTKIPVKNRAQLIDDVLSLARNGHVTYSTGLNLTTYLQKEYHYLPWSVAITALDPIRIALIRGRCHQTFRMYMIELLLQLYKNLGWYDNGNEDRNRRRLRPLVMDTLCKLKYKQCISDARMHFINWKDNPLNNSIHTDMQDVIVCYGIRYGDDGDWVKMSNFAKRKDISVNKQITILKAMTCSTNRILLRRYLNETYHNVNGNKQHMNMIFTEMSKNYRGVNIVFGFIRKYWKQMVKKLEHLPFRINDVFQEISTLFYTDMELKQVEDFFENDFKTSQFFERAQLKFLDKIRSNNMWMRTYKDEVVNWFNHTVSILKQTDEE